jgi:hypothetical protein
VMKVLTGIERRMCEFMDKIVTTHGPSRLARHEPWSLRFSYMTNSLAAMAACLRGHSPLRFWLHPVAFLLYRSTNAAVRWDNLNVNEDSREHEEALAEEAGEDGEDRIENECEKEIEEDWEKESRMRWKERRKLEQKREKKRRHVIKYRNIMKQLTSMWQTSGKIACVTLQYDSRKERLSFQSWYLKATRLYK